MPATRDRLDRITASMTAMERAVLVLKAFNAGEEPDPKLRIIDDPTQAKLFDRYMGLIYVANIELDAMYHALQYQAERLEESITLELLREAAGMVQENTGESVDPKVVRHWRKHANMTHPEFFYGVADEYRRLTLPGILARCREMASLEVAWQELAKEFGGQDLRSSELVQKANETWAKLRALLVRYGGSRRLPAADDEVVEMIHQRIDQALKYLQLVEVAR